MLENFQLAAIVRQGRATVLQRIPMHQGLQDTLAQTWQAQYEGFVDNVQEIDFNAGYKPEEHERFRLENYELPSWLAEEDSQTVADLNEIGNNEGLLDSIKGLAAFARDDEGLELILFQNFNRSHVIRPGYFLFLQANTYRSADGPGLTLDGKLSAVYLRVTRKLLFRSFRTVNTFLPLADFYEEASEKEIREVLNHDLLAPDDADALASSANQWFRKRFAMLRDSNVLDRYSADQIQQRSRGYDINIRISLGKIVFPADKSSAKRLLQFLNEEIYRGPITETLFETNSRREAD